MNNRNFHDTQNKQKMPVIPASLLYVPAHKPELFEKGLASEALAIILDLEDGVPAHEKADSLANVEELLSGTPHKPVYVRVNSDIALLEDELMAIAESAASGVMLPKAELSFASQLVELLPPSMHKILLIESALGLTQVQQLAEIADCFAIGRADLMADLRISEEPIERLLTVLAPIVVASAARGLAAPIAPAHLNIRDKNVSETQEFSRRFFESGFRSQTAIHPWFCSYINEIFIPSIAEYDAAKSMLATFDAADNIGVDADGNFVDPAVLRRVQEVVDRYEH